MLSLMMSSLVLSFDVVVVVVVVPLDDRRRPGTQSK